MLAATPTPSPFSPTSSQPRSSSPIGSTLGSSATAQGFPSANSQPSAPAQSSSALAQGSSSASSQSSTTSSPTPVSNYAPLGSPPTQGFSRNRTGPIPSSSQKSTNSPKGGSMFLSRVVALVLLICGLAFAWSMVFKPSVLTVIGEGKINVPAEKFTLIVTRVASGPDITAALKAGEDGIKLLKETAKTVAGSDIEIQESFYQVQPNTVPQGASYTTVYQVAYAFQVTSKNPTQASELIKSLYLDGATTVSSVSFSSADQKKTDQEARVEAVKDAKERANNIARAAGKNLGRLVSISDDNMESTSTVGQKGENNSSLGKIDITKRVSAVYEIW